MKNNPAPAAPLITLRRVTKVFDEGAPHRLTGVEDITLDIAAGEFFIFAGPSGCGKSTLLRLISGLDRDFQGEIAVGGGLTSRDYGFVFQQFGLLPWLTIGENIGLGLVARRTPQAEMRRVVEKELATFGLAAFKDARPHELSGGMRQRAGIARALATDPKVIFMDEPFSELDSFTAATLRREILAVWHKRRPTIIMVTHLVPEALELADRIAILTPRPGRIERIITNDLPRPRDHRSAAFFRQEDNIYNLIKP
jgi:NitT/TauT family transport system ATP-binding protein